MKKTAMLLLILLTFISCRDEISIITSKQPGKIVGTVLPKESVATIQLIQGEIISTTSTENGIFQFEDVPPGIYRLSIKADNFGKKEIEDIKVEDGEGNDIGIIQLSKYPYPLTRILPYDNEQNVYVPELKIELIFDRDMDISSIEKGFSIEPFKEFSVDYISSSKKYYYVRLSLDYATKYNITLDTVISTVLNNHLEFPITSSFITDHFKFYNIDYPNSSYSRDNGITLYFNGTIKDNFEESITISPNIPVNYSVYSRYPSGSRESYTHLNILSSNGWMADTTINIYFDEEFAEVNGATLEKDTVISFSTPPLLVQRTRPLNGQYFIDISSNIQIDFNYLLDQSTIESAISITPEIEYLISTGNGYSKTSVLLDPNEAFEANTQYTVTISKSLTDFYGIPLRNDYSFSFNTSQ